MSGTSSTEIARNRTGSAGPAEVEAEFDAKASHYESDRLAPWYQAQADYLLDHLETVAGPVVDVGCGTGWLLRKLVKRFPKATGIGVDLSGRMIDEARRRAQSAGLDRLSFVHGDWENRSVRRTVRDHLDEPAALAVCVSVFHYFRDPGTALSGMHELLAPGGRLLVLDRAMDGSMVTRLWDLLHRYVVRDHVRFYRTTELIAMLERAGFSHVKLEGRINRIFWKGKMHTSMALLSAGPEPESPRSAFA